VGEHEGLQYFSMDYVEGQNLAERAREKLWRRCRRKPVLAALVAALHLVGVAGVAALPREEDFTRWLHWFLRSDFIGKTGVTTGRSGPSTRNKRKTRSYENIIEPVLQARQARGMA
jgi:hypothetical protein